MKNQSKIFISIGSVILLALIVLIVVKIVVKGSARREQKKIEENVEEIQEQQQEQQGDIPKATYSKDAYERLANRIYEAMDSSWYNPFSYGTDEWEIVKVFSYMKNNTDYLNLIMAFKTRDGYGLEEWVSSELSSSWIAMINKKLADKGIKYRLK
jgi:ABC-type lipoprotein release transport system permease subunit